MVVAHCSSNGGEVGVSSLLPSSTSPEPPSSAQQYQQQHHSSSFQLQPTRVIIIGDPKVGKTALVVRFLTRRFIGQYSNNTDKRYTYSVDSLATPISHCYHHHQYLATKSWDPTAAAANNHSGFCAITSRRPLIVEFVDVSQSPIEDHLETSDGSFVVVYNICERSSFLTAKRLVWMIRKLKEPIRVPVLLVGNKKDLAETHRQVTVEEVERLGRDCDVIAVETSAAADAPGVTAAFNRLLVETRQFVDERRRFDPTSSIGDDSSSSSSSSARRKSSLTILSSLQQMFSTKRKRRKPHTL